MVEIKGHTSLKLENLKEKANLGDLTANGRIIQKWILENQTVKVLTAFEGLKRVFIARPLINLLVFMQHTEMKGIINRLCHCEGEDKVVCF